jgi:murein L,D-transpeptidase YafK
MFDGSTREVCVSRRIRTNTPLQALVTLNDSSFVVAARNFATEILKHGKNSREQIKAGYKMMLVREMPEKKLAVLNGLYENALQQYKKDSDATLKLTKREASSSQLAAMTIVASAMLNLDEVLTKE